MNIFISYRRDDSSVHARLLYKELLGYFEADEVFMDIEDIGYGDDFANLIDEHLEHADVVLVVIGPQWVELVEQRLRGDDWVRHEVERALALREAGHVRVLPVFVGGAAWGRARLPARLAGLKKLNALSVADRRFDEDLRTVVEAIRRRRIWDDLVDAVRGRRARRTGMAIGLLTFAASWVAVLDHFGIDTRLATTTMWLASVGATPQSSGQVVLVAIDERTEAAVGRDFDASWRAEHARIIERVAQARARVLAFDMVLVHAGEPHANQALRAALTGVDRRMPVIFGRDGRRSSNPQVQALTAEAVNGIACAARKIGLARSLPLAVKRADEEDWQSSLALAAFSGGGGIETIDENRQHVLVRRLPEDKLITTGYFASENVAEAQQECPAIGPGDRVLTQLIDPATLPPPGDMRSIPYESVLHGDAAALAALAGRMVLVGVLRSGEDRLEVPGNTQRWGAELIAAQIDAMARGQTIRAPGPLVQGTATVGMGLSGALIVIALHRRPRRWKWLVLLAAALLFWAAAVGWYRVEQQLISLPYGWAALALGALAARHILKGKPA